MSTKDLSENSHSYLLVELQEPEWQEYHCYNNDNVNIIINNNINIILIILFTTITMT